jgi:hypothetical protein
LKPSSLGNPPLWQRLAQSQRILIAGCGGGFDVYSGLPIYMYLKPRAKAVYLANLSFASLTAEVGRRLTPALTYIDAHTQGSEEYFPERMLCRFLATQGIETGCYCLLRTGAQLLLEGYQKLCQELQLDAVVVVDGGTDSLMRGDESGLGTPQEDLAHLVAVSQLQLPTKLLCCLGFGVDTFDGVRHSEFLANVAALQKLGGFLGTLSLLPDMPEARALVEAVDYANEQLPSAPSVVSNSIVSAIEGHSGDYHRTWRTQGSQLFISPLMSMYWNFEMDAVVKRCLYAKELLKTRGYAEVEKVINDFRQDYPRRSGPESIPY